VAPPPASSSDGNTAASDGETAPADSTTQVQGGNYTLFVADTVAANCVGFESVTVPSSELGLTPEPISLSTSGSNIILDGDTLVQQANGEYFGNYTFDDGSNAQIYLRATSNNSFQGQMIVNFVDEGDTCSATVGVSIR
jgi:hypothetical protein